MLEACPAAALPPVPFDMPAGALETFDPPAPPALEPPVALDVGALGVVAVVGVVVLGDEPLIAPESLPHATPINASRLAAKACFQLPRLLVMARSLYRCVTKPQSGVQLHDAQRPRNS